MSMEQGILPDFYADKIANIVLENSFEITKCQIFKALGGTLTKDGNQWCANIGEWPEHNISGFGSSPYEAIAVWYSEYGTSIKTNPNETGKG